MRRCFAKLQLVLEVEALTNVFISVFVTELFTESVLECRL